MPVINEICPFCHQNHYLVDQCRRAKGGRHKKDPVKMAANANKRWDAWRKAHYPETATPEPAAEPAKTSPNWRW